MAYSGSLPQPPPAPPAVLDHQFDRPHREVIHLFSADPEEGLPTEFADTLQPGLFSSEEFDAVSFFLIQKLVQRKEPFAGVAKVPAHLLRAGRLTCHHRFHRVALDKQILHDSKP